MARGSRVRHGGATAEGQSEDEGLHEL